MDASSLLYRFFYALIARPLRNSWGENTSASLGFANFLNALRAEHGPEYLGVVFDSRPVHREALYPKYKATRQKMPAELRDSIPRVRELLLAHRTRPLRVEGWEADDVIGTLARQAEREGLEAVIVSPDKDFLQLASDSVSILKPSKGGPAGSRAEWITASDVSRRVGVSPGQVVDYLALVGDASDNVPGAPGVGAKTAAPLLARFGTLDEALQRADEIKGKRPREALQRFRDQILLSRDLVTIKTDLELPVSLEDLRVRPPDIGKLRKLYQILEFRELERRLGPVAAGEASVNDASPAPELIQTRTKAARVAAEAKKSGIVGVCVFTRALRPARDALAGIAIATGSSSVYYLPIGSAGKGALPLLDPDPPGPEQEALEPIAAILEDEDIAIAGHDLKASLVACRRAGMKLRGPLQDVMLASYLLDPGRSSHELGRLAGALLDATVVRAKDILGAGKSARPFGDMKPEDVLEYAGQRARLPLLIWKKLSGKLANPPLDRLFREVETPLMAVLADMEIAGVAVNPDFFRALAVDLGRKLKRLREAIYEKAGGEFNIDSPKQLARVLFEELGLPVLKKTKRGPSTDISVLQDLRKDHRLPGLVIEYRANKKLRSGYLLALPKLVNPATGRIHTTFNQAVAATGRLSSSEPNLQNIPFRTEPGRSIRKGFVAPEGKLLVCADYSQIELRVLAHLSRDEVFLRAFREGKDIHRETASAIFGIPSREVTSELRGRAKTVNYATLYGQEAFSLARQLDVTVREARAFIDSYFARFAGVRRYLDAQVEKARAKGYVSTLLGRWRKIPQISDRNWNVRRFGERIAKNTPVQGTAADLIKLAMLKVGSALESRPGSRMVLQVHDELIFEAADGEASPLARDVARIMESALDLDVPLVVDVAIGKSWYDCKG